MSTRERKGKRVKVEFSVCKMTFDSDYRKEHDEKYNGKILFAHPHIGYKIFGTPQNPSAFSDCHPTLTLLPSMISKLKG